MHISWKKGHDVIKYYFVSVTENVEYGKKALQIKISYNELCNQMNLRKYSYLQKNK